ncbi:unnamed protein product [Durusdinium trenchii]|uniref:EF-hand domain-containing protein n=1 Tax=Durusdinium trenchii TaxID=1381693 RepID=A0ABP0ISK3_9DINO
MALRLTPLRGLLWCAPHLGCARRLLLLPQNSLSRRQVITGVFVDTAIQTSNSQRDIQIEREMELKDSFLKSLKDFFEALDTDGSGSIHLEEIKIMLQDPTLAAYFAVLGFDEVNANQIFHLLDDDESGEVSIEEFLEGCSKLKGAARSIDVHALMHQCRALHRELNFVASMLGVDMHSSTALAHRHPYWNGRGSRHVGRATNLPPATSA